VIRDSHADESRKSHPVGGALVPHHRPAHAGGHVLGGAPDALDEIRKGKDKD